MRIKEATAFLDSLEKKGIVFGLEREKKFLSFIGNPEKRSRDTTPEINEARERAALQQ